MKQSAQVIHSVISFTQSVNFKKKTRDPGRRLDCGTQDTTPKKFLGNRQPHLPTLNLTAHLKLFNTFLFRKKFIARNRLQYPQHDPHLATSWERLIVWDLVLPRLQVFQHLGKFQRQSGQARHRSVVLRQL